VGKTAEAARDEEVNKCSVGGGLNQILVKRFNYRAPLANKVWRIGVGVVVVSRLSPSIALFLSEIESCRSR
jgi:hypothetical protein